MSILPPRPASRRLNSTSSLRASASFQRPIRSNSSRRQHPNRTVSTRRGASPPPGGATRKFELPTPNGTDIAVAIAFPTSVGILGSVSSRPPTQSTPRSSR